MRIVQYYPCHLMPTDDPMPLVNSQGHRVTVYNSSRIVSTLFIKSLK